MMTATTDRAALYAGILERPEDDVARLVYADWLEENDGSEPCGRCKGTGWRPNAPASGLLSSRPYPDFPSFATIGCPHCGGKRDHKGSGTVPNGNAERAEFIRVQINRPESFELTVTRDPVEPEFVPFPAELLRADAWLRTPAADSAFGRKIPGGLLTWRYVFGSAIGTVSRGFVASVRCRLADWVGGPCEDCNGHGRHGDHSEAECKTCGGEPGSGKCGTGRTPAHGPRIVAEQPVERVEITDAIADPIGDERCWVKDRPNLIGGARVPPEIFDLLEGGRLESGGNEWAERFGVEDFWRIYPTESAALSALSLALVNWARREAGLPPLREHATH